jgi:hypothetical protein
VAGVQLLLLLLLLPLVLVMAAAGLQVDMLVGDIYGGRDYSAIGLSASTIACSFGKVVGQDKELQDYNPAGEPGLASEKEWKALYAH